MMIKKTGILAIICVMIAAPVFAETFTVILLDLSGSMKTDNTGGKKGSPLEKNMGMLKTEIGNLRKSDRMLVMGFGRKTDVVLLKVTAPSSAGAMNKNLVAMRESAIKKLNENLKSRIDAIDSSRTDVVGACFRASRVIDETRSAMASNNSITTRLVILSDLLDNESLGLSLVKLKRDGINREILKKAEKTGYPNMKGVEIDVYSAFADIQEANTVETEAALKELKLFWGEYFRRSGGIVKSFKTSY